MPGGGKKTFEEIVDIDIDPILDQMMGGIAYLANRHIALEEDGDDSVHFNMYNKCSA